MAKTALWWLGAGLLIIVVAFVWNMAADTTQTVQKEYAPSAMLKKYEYFKDLSAGIDKKRADIEMYREEIISLDSTKNTSRDDKFYYEQRKSELIGIISIHNSLCAQYNSGMSKFNYQFANKGQLPQSNLEPLPREYKPYILSLKK
jgi:hypothetical protein